MKSCLFLLWYKHIPIDCKADVSSYKLQLFFNSNWLIHSYTYWLCEGRSTMKPWDWQETGVIWQNATALGGVTLHWSQRCHIWTSFALSLPTGFTNSHLQPFLPPQLPPYLSDCHLHLHSGPFQWWEAFISAARQDADMERAALLQRTMYLLEHMQARGHIWGLQPGAFSQTPNNI